VKFAFVTARYGADISSGPITRAVYGRAGERPARRGRADHLREEPGDLGKRVYSEGTDRCAERWSDALPSARRATNTASGQFFRARDVGPRTRADELEWLRRAGPWSAGLIDFIRRQHKSYDVLVFFSICSPLTVNGAIVAPSAALSFRTCSSSRRFALTSVPKCFRPFAASDWSRRRTPTAALVRARHAAPRRARRHRHRSSPEQSYPRHQQDPADTVVDDEAVAGPEEAEEQESYLAGRGVPFRRRHRLYGPFAMYGGRVEPDNGCEEMLEYFNTFAESDSDTVLALMGVKMMKVRRAVHQARRRAARTRTDDCLQGGRRTIAPSPTIWWPAAARKPGGGTPVLASARNGAAVEHCRARMRLYYANREDSSRRCAADDEQEARSATPVLGGDRQRTYVRQNFTS
jgi:hypothetical protein